MADPRFFENLGPFTLAQICEKIGSMLPADADGSKTISDLADLAGEFDTDKLADNIDLDEKLKEFLDNNTFTIRT